MSRFGLRVEKQYFDFSMGHFLLFRDGTREPLHGHNYRCYVEVEGKLSSDDMVLNYIFLKPLVKRLCDQLNHRMALPLENKDLKVWEEGESVFAEYHDGSKFMFPKQDCILLKVHNTSTEILAQHLLGRLIQELKQQSQDQKTTEGQNDYARLSKIRVAVEEAPGQLSWFESDLHLDDET